MFSLIFSDLTNQKLKKSTFSNHLQKEHCPGAKKAAGAIAPVAPTVPAALVFVIDRSSNHILFVLPFVMTGKDSNDI